MSAEKPQEDVVDVYFHGVEYVLSLATDGISSLEVDLEQVSDGKRWRAEFPSKYIEDITAKTGNHKRFEVFVEMLRNALTRTSASVCVDLLTFQDLRLHQRRSQQAGGEAPPPPAKHASKRYLILTYQAEYDRVHYPMPLAYEAEPSAESLQRTIRRLKREVDMYRKAEGTAGSKRKAIDPSAAAGSGASHGSAPALPRLQREVDHLRARLEECQGSLDASNQSVRLLQSQLSDSEAGRRSAEQVLEKLRSTSGKEIKRLRRDKEALEARLQAVAEDAEGALGEVRAADERKIEELKHKNKTLRERVRELTKQLAMGGGGAGRSGTRSGAAHRRTGRVLSRGRSPRATSRSRGSAARRPSSRSGRSVTSVGSGRSGASRRAGSVASRRSASTAGSRASSRGRFDPTEYVRRKKQALEDRKRSRGRLPMVAGGRTKARTRGPTTPSRQPAAAAVSPALSRRSGVSRASGRSARSGGTASRRRVRAAASGATPGSTASGRSGRARGGVTRTGGTSRGSGYSQRPSTASGRSRGVGGPAKRRAGPSPYGTGPMRVPANRGRGGYRPRSSGGPLSAKEARQRLKAAVASGSQGRSYRARPWAEGSEAAGGHSRARSRSGSRGGRREDAREADDGVHNDRGVESREYDALRQSTGSGFGMDTTDPAAALRAADAVLSAGPSPDLAVSGGGYGAGRGTRRGQGGHESGHRGGQSGGIAEPPVVPRQAWVDPDELQQQEAQGAGGRGGGSGRAADPSGKDGHSAPPHASRTQQEGDGSGADELGAAGRGAQDAPGNDGGGLHNEVSSIDDRLRKLYDFLKAAKEGKPVELPQ